MNTKTKNKEKIPDIYDLDKRLEYAERRVLNSKICKWNKDLILQYRDYIELVRSLSKPRIEKWLNTLVPIARMLGKPFDEADEEDVKRLIKKIRSSHYSARTQEDFQICIKKFWKWLKHPDKNRELEEYPLEVKWIKVKRAQRESLSPKHIPNWDDILAMIKHCRNPRDKAFVATLFDSGNRIGEQLPLTIDRVEILQHGVNLKIGKSKTKLRDNFIYMSVPYLLEWMECHPRKDDPNAPLWCRINDSLEDDLMGYDYCRKLLRVLGRKAGITGKRLNPHNFRHGSMSFWSDYLTESQIKYKFGLVQSSKVLDIYIHKDSKGITNTILKLAGVEIKENGNGVMDAMKVQRCYFCGKDNPPERKLCYNCKRMLNPDVSVLEDHQQKERVKAGVWNRLEEIMEKNPEKADKFLGLLEEGANRPK